MKLPNQVGAGACSPACQAHASRVMTLLLLSLAGCGETKSPTDTPVATTDTPVATTVTLSAATLSFSSLEDTQQLTATVRDQNGATMSGTPVTWVSAASNVASVSSTGLVTAVADGTATVTATLGSATGTASVTVATTDTPVATTVTLSAATLSFSSLEDTQQLTATVRDQNGATMSGTPVTWVSAASNVASVSSTGLVTAVADGTATVTATLGSATGTASVTVQQVAAEVTLSPSSLVLAGPGTTETVTASVIDAGGSEIVNPDLTWSSSDESIATVSGSALVTAVAIGLATITVTNGGQTVTQAFSITVNPPLRLVRIAFIADQGYGEDPRAVLRLIREEGVDAVLHQGDFDYGNYPDLWMKMIDEELGQNFPYFASVGNHDLLRSGCCTDTARQGGAWGAKRGYRERLEDRASRLGYTWTGIYGERASLSFEGIRILLGAPGIFDGTENSTYANYFAEELAADTATWRICSWHRNQLDMQVGGNEDQVGYAVYEACREGGAIIATGHEHSYSRTHLLSDVSEHIVASTSDTLEIAEGRTFVFVSGLGGRSIRSQRRWGDWWASIYTATQGARYGALFASFNVDADPSLAHFYFKDVGGQIVDEFWVRSRVH